MILLCVWKRFLFFLFCDFVFFNLLVVIGLIRIKKFIVIKWKDIFDIGYVLGNLDVFVLFNVFVIDIYSYVFKIIIC